MELNLMKFKREILQNKFKGNQRQCAMSLNISAEFLNKVLKKRGKAGALFLGKLKVYCDNNNFNFDTLCYIGKSDSKEYIFKAASFSYQVRNSLIDSEA